MGAVFEAHDRERSARVALKTLRTPNPEALLYLKNEFRALQDVRHANLVNLLELIEDDGRWFVTMELIDGVDFLAYTRPGYSDATVSGMSETARVDTHVPISGVVSSAAPKSLSVSGEGYDEHRLRSTLAQLTRGLCALHDAGRVHRDVKPSNVLVTLQGRVVLVDFGLTLSTMSGEGRAEARAVGTRAFMAPEQAAGSAVSSASDWYSVGVVLYLALTGELPFRGADMARRRAHQPPPPVRDLSPDAPEDFGDPRGRPSSARSSGTPHRTGGAPPFGSGQPAGGGERAVRGSERRGGPARTRIRRQRIASVTTVVMGDSGVGKSALVREVIARLEAASSEALILTGRCYERELVPYKAFDGIVDALSHFLADSSQHTRRACCPVMRRLWRGCSRHCAGCPLLPMRNRPWRPIHTSNERSRSPPCARSSRDRRRATGSLVHRRPAVGRTADSHLLLADLLQPPDAPPSVSLRPRAPRLRVPRIASFISRIGSDKYIAFRSLLCRTRMR